MTSISIPNSPSWDLEYRNLVSTTIRLPEFCLPLPLLPWLSFKIEKSFCPVYQLLISLLLLPRIQWWSVDFLESWRMSKMLSELPYFSDSGEQRGENGYWAKRPWLKRVARPRKKKQMSVTNAWKALAYHLQEWLQLPSPNECQGERTALTGWEQGQPETLRWVIRTHWAKLELRLLVCTSDMRRKRGW